MGSGKHGVDVGDHCCRDALRHASCSWRGKVSMAAKRQEGHLDIAQARRVIARLQEAEPDLRFWFCLAKGGHLPIVSIVVPF